MKRALFLLTLLALTAACSSEKPVENQIPKQNIELTGNGFQLFTPGADLKLVMVANPDNNKEWTVRASVPMMKIAENPISETLIDLNLLDENGMKVRDGFVLSAEDLGNLIPKYNADKNVENTLVFSANGDTRKFFSYKEAADILNRTKSVAMNVNMPQAEPEVAVNPEEKKPEPVTFSSLMEKYGVYGKLSQYDKALKNKEKKKAKQIEDGLYEICKRVKADPTVPESVAQRFRDYIEDKEDEIEKKY